MRMQINGTTGPNAYLQQFQCASLAALSCTRSSYNQPHLSTSVFQRGSIMMWFIFKASHLLVLMLHDKKIISLVTESQLVDRLLVISAIAYYLVRDVCQALANQQLVTNFLANQQLAYVSINKQGYPHYQNLLNLNSRNLPMRYYSKSVSLEELVHSLFSLSNLVF